MINGAGFDFFYVLDGLGCWDGIFGVGLGWVEGSYGIAWRWYNGLVWVLERRSYLVSIFAFYLSMAE